MSSDPKGRLQDLEVKAIRALLIGTYQGPTAQVSCQEYLDELASLTDTYGGVVVEKIACPIREYHASTFIGKGKVEEIREKKEALQCDLVIFDDEISPQQQRNLEKIFSCVVIDRTELILGVFAQRAHTKEAKIQVELANVRYQLPRLRRMWTHLSRQRSGGASGGFVKGEGEKQIELDRRILRRRMDLLSAQLAHVEKHRAIQRKARAKQEIPIVAIVGYTNVGKSTLLNSLTAADVLVEDKLFATLDPTIRKFTLPNRQSLLLIDTVGFIRKIPHFLIAAFKSTLEEALQADILLHLMDASHPMALERSRATLEVLKELKADSYPMIPVFNKMDQAKDPLLLMKLRITYPKAVEISAFYKEGFMQLFHRMAEEIAALRKKVHLRIPQSEYALVSEICQKGAVCSVDYEANDVLLEVEIPRSLERKIEPYLTED